MALAAPARTAMAPTIVIDPAIATAMVESGNGDHLFLNPLLTQASGQIRTRRSPRRARLRMAKARAATTSSSKVGSTGSARSLIHPP